MRPAPSRTVTDGTGQFRARETQLCYCVFGPAGESFPCSRSKMPPGSCESYHNKSTLGCNQGRRKESYMTETKLVNGKPHNVCPCGSLARTPFGSICTTCYCRKWRAANREKVRGAKRRRYWSNPDVERKRSRLRRAKDPKKATERTNQWRAAHPDAAKAISRRAAKAWRSRNPDKNRGIVARSDRKRRNRQEARRRVIQFLAATQPQTKQP